MNLLILGGTVFLGRHIVASALASGHNVSTFNRGNNLLEEQAKVEKITGDRQRDLERLAGRNWDAVIDTCGMDPATVAKSVEVLSSSVDRYVFISSISAFADFRKIGINERYPARLLPPEQEQDYGSFKAHCEKLVLDKLGKKSSLIIRPGLIVGRYDQSDRFTYWVRRIKNGGRILAPGSPERQIQFIDVRDLSDWIVRLVEAKISGTFCATGPGFTLLMKEFLYKCREIAKSDAEFIWVEDEQLLRSELKAWSELPLWIPDSDSDFAGFMQIDCLRAQNTGLSYRSIDETIEDILAWDNTRDQSIPLKAGLDPNKEIELLAAAPAAQR